MDPLRYAETAYRIEHRHKDGAWGEMVDAGPARPGHGPADHDSERGWLRGRILRCTSCDEEVTIVPGGEGAPPKR